MPRSIIVEVGLPLTEPPTGRVAEVVRVEKVDGESELRGIVGVGETELVTLGNNERVGLEEPVYCGVAELHIVTNDEIEVLAETEGELDWERVGFDEGETPKGLRVLNCGDEEGVAVDEGSPGLPEGGRGVLEV